MHSEPRTINKDSSPVIKHVYYYRVGIPKRNKKGEVDFMEGDKPYFLEEKIPVLAENDNYIILDDLYFTDIRKEKDSVLCCLEKENLSHRTGDNIFCGGIFFSLYTVNKREPSSIKNKVKRFVDRELGYLGSIDLSFIK